MRKNLNLIPLINACRPNHWAKNLLVYAAPIFSFRLEIGIWLSATFALISFCLISSSIYLINDVLDIEADQIHPKKYERPIAAGLVSKNQAIGTSTCLAVSSILIAYFSSPSLSVLILLYFFIQLSYCLKLKEEPLLDIFCISAGFLLRAIAGAIASGLPISPWFLLSVGLLALFLGIEKRKAELRISIERGVITRKVLKRYSLPLLLRLESSVATSSFMAYSLWAAGPALKGAATSWMLITVPFVLVGIFRYQLLSDPEEAKRRKLKGYEQTCENPEEILFKDRGMQITLGSWIMTTFLIGMVIRLSS